MSSSIVNPDLVVSDPKILSGEPVFAGTRVTIDIVLACVDAGIDMARIRASYPIVDEEHIAAARAYRAAHPRKPVQRLGERYPELRLRSQGVVRRPRHGN
jgi:uncharacterized protein (DUF433 family)